MRLKSWALLEPLACGAPWIIYITSPVFTATYRSTNDGWNANKCERSRQGWNNLKLRSDKHSHLSPASAHNCSVPVQWIYSSTNRRLHGDKHVLGQRVYIYKTQTIGRENPCPPASLLHNWAAERPLWLEVSFAIQEGQELFKDNERMLIFLGFAAWIKLPTYRVLWQTDTFLHTTCGY